MKAASVSEIKQALSAATHAELVALCLRLSKFKKENKELLTYLLFEMQDEQAFIRSIQEEMDELFASINYSHLYYAKKSLRKILRLINKFSRYSGNAATEAELRLYFCQKMQDSPLNRFADKALGKIFSGQIEKVKKLISNMHEDLQYDYKKMLETLE